MKFYNQSTIKVAKSLLGCNLIHETKEGKTIGKIVETEAYLENDEASHSSRGKTKRNEKMFGKPGTAYIYLIYGMYKCFNVVTRKEGIGEAVLIRSLEPVKGIELMKKRRKTSEIKNLCSGPGKLVQALGISREQNGSDITKGKLKIIPKKSNHKIVGTTRIGISRGADLDYRFYIKGNKFVSRE